MGTVVGKEMLRVHVLLVEDDDPLRAAVAAVLEEEAFRVDQAATGYDGLLLAETGIYDALVVDVMLPELDGLSLIKRLRERGILVPALFLTARDSVEARVAGLNAGADDYLVKPFAVEELLARIRALLRRNGNFGLEDALRYGPLCLPRTEHDAFIGEEPLKLTTKEYELLKYLVINKEQILTRPQILQRVWGIDSDANDSVVDLYIHYLRKKLAAHGFDRWVRTVRSVGYMLKGD